MIISDTKTIYESVVRQLVEDEYFSAIENRDKRIAEQDKQLAEQGEQLAEKDGQLAQQGKQLAEKDQMLASTIKMLVAANVSIQNIAVNLNLKEEEVARIMAANSKE